MNRFYRAIFVGALVVVPALAQADRWQPLYRGGTGYRQPPIGHGNQYRHPFYRGADWNRGYAWGDSSRSYQPRGPIRSFDQGAIERGIRTGALSRDEVKRLEKEQQKLAKQESRAWRDGRLDRDERRDLREERRDYYKDLNHQLTDDERAKRSRRWGW